MKSKNQKVIIVLSFLVVFLSKIHPIALAQSNVQYNITSIDWSADGSKIAVAIGPSRCKQEDFEEADYSVRIFDAETSEIITKIGNYQCSVVNVQWSGDNTRLLVSSNESTADIWDTTTGTSLVSSTGYTQPGRLLDVWSHTEDRVGHLSEGYPSIVIWNASNGSQISQFSNNGSRTLAWSPDDSRMILGGANVKMINTFTGLDVATFTGTTSGASAVAWSPDGTMIAAGGGDGKLYIWDAITYLQVQNIVGHTDTVSKLEWSLDSSKLASVSLDGTGRVWNPYTGEQMLMFTGSNIINDVAWHPDGSRLVYGGIGSGEVLTMVEIPTVSTPTPSPTFTLTPTATSTPTETPTNTPTLSL